MSVDYKKPILFRLEPYAVESWVNRVGSSSFGLSAKIKDDDTVLSLAEAVLVTFDLKAQKGPVAQPARAGAPSRGPRELTGAGPMHRCE